MKYFGEPDGERAAVITATLEILGKTKVNNGEYMLDEISLRATAEDPE